MTGNELRAAVVATARAWLGRKEADGSFWEIVKYYNDHRPPGAYEMQYNDPWCAAFVSAVGIKTSLDHNLACGPYGLLAVNVGCIPMIDQYIAWGEWQENDDYSPRPGDVILYDWEDSGSGDNHGSPDHAGIVTEMVGNTITVIEGNKSDSVCYRTLKRDGLYIRGYGCPDYDKLAEGAGEGGDDPEPTPAPEPTPTPTPGVTGLPTLRQGDGIGCPNECVRAAQFLLIGRGFRCGPWGADGEFGSATYGAVYQFQRAKGIAVDGVIGPESWGALLGVI